MLEPLGREEVEPFSQSAGVLGVEDEADGQFVGKAVGQHLEIGDKRLSTEKAPEVDPVIGGAVFLPGLKIGLLALGPAEVGAEIGGAPVESGRGIGVLGPDVLGEMGQRSRKGLEVELLFQGKVGLVKPQVELEVGRAPLDVPVEIVVGSCGQFHTVFLSWDR
ncbi:MAG TPA: hypothetical protein VLF94_05995 [Chlamydiales bacterium]|nr:hypothetical protein [Chlamydiales bacterium]